MNGPNMITWALKNRRKKAEESIKEMSQMRSRTDSNHEKTWSTITIFEDKVRKWSWVPEDESDCLSSSQQGNRLHTAITRNGTRQITCMSWQVVKTMLWWFPVLWDYMQRIQPSHPKLLTLKECYLSHWVCGNNTVILCLPPRFARG